MGIPEVISFSNMTNDQLVETEAKVPVRTNVYETEGHTLHTFNGSPSLDEMQASWTQLRTTDLSPCLPQSTKLLTSLLERHSERRRQRTTSSQRETTPPLLRN